VSTPAAAPPRLVASRPDVPSLETTPEYVNHGVPVFPLPPGLQPFVYRLREYPWIWAALEAEATAMDAKGATGEVILRIPTQYGRLKEPRVDAIRRHHRPQKGRTR
jgi:hypothetical protein